MTAHVKSISTSGVRTLDQFRLDLDGLTVLIGENGSGKSTIVEACELLRRLTNKSFLKEYNSIHGGDSTLLRIGHGEIDLGATISRSPWIAYYEIRFNRNGISEERLQVAHIDDLTAKVSLIERTAERITFQEMGVGHKSEATVHSQVPAISLQGWSPSDPIVREVSEALANIDVQLPFNTMAYWSTKSQGGQVSPLRDSVTIAPAEQLERFGVNLANAYFSLKNETAYEEWDFTMELVRLGLGTWVESVNARPDAAGGKIALWIKPKNIDQQISATSLSDGQLAYLAFVAMARLPGQRSILCFDELELHLHPRLLVRVLSLMETIAETTPVLLTTHSRRVLDELTNPAQSVGVLELEPKELRTVVRRLDEDALESWLANYDGLGHLLDAGYQESFLATPAGGSEQC